MKGKKFGPPPEKGPQPQGMNHGRLVEPKLKERSVKKGIVKKKIQDIRNNKITIKYLPRNRTEYSKTIKTQKGFTNVPSLYGNKELNEDELTKMYSKTKTDPLTNRRVKTYKTQKEAISAAERRSNQIVRRNKGGTTDGAKFVKFFGEQFNQNKDKVLKEALTGVFKRDFKSRFKNRMNQAFTDFEKQNKGSSYGNNFTGYNPKKQETGITTKETMGLKFGGMGCPHREMGAKSDIQGVKDIQLTGKSFKGVK
jgi:hypothetical protein